ncbi:MAG: dTDP-4-dehydrorhamnose 3,5-epimerase [Bacteroidota bacterium]
MNVIKTNIEDLLVFEPKVWGDERGYFFESYNMSTLKENGLAFDWVQDNESFSEKGVLRGLHYQLPPFGQTKLVRVAYGEVLDVVVDIRIGSKTFGKTFSIILSGTNKKQLLVPRGFAHGYVVLSPTALFLYKVDNVYNAESDAGIRFDDPDLGIDWILPSNEVVQSKKDMANPFFANHIPYK